MSHPLDVERTALQGDLVTAIRALPAQQVLLLHYDSGYSEWEITRILPARRGAAPGAYVF